MDIKDIKDLIITIDKTDIETVEIEKADIKMIISKNSYSKNNKSDTTLDTSQTSVRQVEVEDKEESIIVEDLFIVRSPVVGVYYQSSSPEEKAYVSLGSKVEKGSVLCIIEAMKIMNEIECEVSGEIVEILVENEDMVEYGQALMKIRR